MKKFKIVVLSFVAILISTMVLFGVANAQSVEITNDINIESDRVIDRMLVTGGDNVNIAGTVNGDVFCAGENIVISGNVKGDVFCIGQSISISGDIDGSARLISRQIVVSGTISNNFTVGARNLIIEKDGVVGIDLLGLSDNLIIKGEIGRDLVASAALLSLTGSIGRDATGNYEALTISSGTIGGKLEYTGKNDPRILGDGKVIGTVTRNEPTDKDSSRTGSSKTIASTVASLVYMLVAIGGLAVILTLLTPRIFEKSAQNVIKSPAIVAVTGLIAIGILPVIIIVLIISFIGIPIALFLLLLWLMISIMGAFFIAYLIGRLIMKDSKAPALIMLVGIGILITANYIPIINFLTFITVSVFGIGSVLVYCKDVIKSQR